MKQILAIVLLAAVMVSISNRTYSENRPDSVTTTLSGTYPASHNSGTLKDFPKLHPLVVHIPIMCLILAMIAQLVSFFVFKKELSWVALSLTVIGFIGAYISSGIFHGGDPDLTLLNPVTRATFEKHELYAHYTVWLSGLACLAKVTSHFFMKRRWMAELIVMALLAACSYTVAVTGEMGARLVHIDGLGVQGRDLPAHDDM